MQCLCAYSDCVCVCVLKLLNGSLEGAKKRLKDRLQFTSSDSISKMSSMVERRLKIHLVAVTEHQELW